MSLKNTNISCKQCLNGKHLCVTWYKLFWTNFLSFLHGQTCTGIPEISFSVPIYEALFSVITEL
jgi:hypothetical protein